MLSFPKQIFIDVDIRVEIKKIKNFPGVLQRPCLASF